MVHSPGFLKLVDETRRKVKEITVEEARARLASHPGTLLVDVREDDEWRAGRATEAIHLGKGVFERDVEKKVPEPGTELLLYCGGGYRSVLVAEVALRMGYPNVYSVIGGFKAMTGGGWPTSAG